MDYLLRYSDTVLRLTGEHLAVSLGAVAIAVAIGLPLGILAAKVLSGSGMGAGTMRRAMM